jgi:SAM-dependent methyltransferase
MLSAYLTPGQRCQSAASREGLISSSRILSTVLAETIGGSLLESGSADRCWACDGLRFAPPFKVREMMFGLREEFEYHECMECGSLQIVEIPSEIGRYYPSDYCSFSGPTPPPSSLGVALKPVRSLVYSSRLPSEALHRLRETLVPCPIRSAVDALLPDLYAVHQMNLLGAGPDTRILDIGSGSGRFLRTLRSLGFRRLTGIDPFVEKDIEEEGVRILKTDLFGVEGQFDVLAFNHSLEHMSEPVEVLRRACEVLTDRGRCMVRLPVAGSYAWRKYRENWVQLDPPRHLMVPSVVGFGKLADRAGMSVCRTEFDSTWLQFYGSEQYLRDILPAAHTNGTGGSIHSVFTDEEMKEFAKHATRLNNEGDGDQAAFYLKKA